MSSLRPLATITLLAVAGVVLYMKINETEPAIPAGVGEWSIEGPVVESGGAATSATPSSIAAAGTGTDAPPFVATPATASSPAAPQALDAAPAWTAETAVPPADTPTDQTATAQSDAEASPIARSATQESTMPQMPAMPGSSSVAGAGAGAATAAAAAGAAAVAVQQALESNAPAPVGNDAPKFDAGAAGASLPSTTDSAGAGDPLAVAGSPATSTAATAAPETGSGRAQSMFAAARVAVQGALDRGELAQALLLLSDWYDDPSLTPSESAEVNALLAQLAGSVIYEGPPAHRLEQAYVVQAGETLGKIAQKYNVPEPLLAKINGIADPNALQPGQELKVVRGPFSALVDLSERKMTLMLDRRYAGRFAIELDPQTTIEEGQWQVGQKLLTPGGAALYGTPTQSAEDRSLLLANLAKPDGPVAVMRGPGATDPVSSEPRGRVIRLGPADVNDIYDILSEGSRVTIRR